MKTSWQWCLCVCSLLVNVWFGKEILPSQKLKQTPTHRYFVWSLMWNLGSWDGSGLERDIIITSVGFCCVHWSQWQLVCAGEYCTRAGAHIPRIYKPVVHNHSFYNEMKGTFAFPASRASQSSLVALISERANTKIDKRQRIRQTSHNTTFGWVGR